MARRHDRIIILTLSLITETNPARPLWFILDSFLLLLDDLQVSLACDRRVPEEVLKWIVGVACDLADPDLLHVGWVVGIDRFLQ
jgi:hypothetical protein